MRFTKQHLIDAHANYIKKLQHENKDWVTCDYQLQGFLDFLLADETIVVPPLVAAAPELLEVMKWIMPKIHQAYHGGELLHCNQQTCSEYRKVIAKAEGGES